MCNQLLNKMLWEGVHIQFVNVARPAMIYGNESWLMKKALEKKLNVAEMWMMGKQRDRMQNDAIQKMAGVVEASRKAQERTILVWKCNEERGV